MNSDHTIPALLGLWFRKLGRLPMAAAPTSRWPCRAALKLRARLRSLSPGITWSKSLATPNASVSSSVKLGESLPDGLLAHSVSQNT